MACKTQPSAIRKSLLFQFVQKKSAKGLNTFKIMPRLFLPRLRNTKRLTQTMWFTHTSNSTAWTARRSLSKHCNWTQRADAWSIVIAKTDWLIQITNSLEADTHRLKMLLIQLWSSGKTSVSAKLTDAVVLPWITSYLQWSSQSALLSSFTLELWGIEEHYPLGSQRIAEATL